MKGELQKGALVGDETETTVNNNVCLHLARAHIEIAPLNVGPAQWRCVVASRDIDDVAIENSRVAICNEKYIVHIRQGLASCPMAMSTMHPCKLASVGLCACQLHCSTYLAVTECCTS